MRYVTEVLKKLGIDLMDGDYRFDGSNLEIDGVSDDEIEAAEASLDIPALEKAQRNEDADRKRREEYPSVGDQLDAIWKELNQLRLGGTNLVADADDVLGKILAVKKKHPKEK